MTYLSTSACSSSSSWRDRPLGARAADRVDEVADALDREQEVAEVVIAEPRAGSCAARFASTAGSMNSASAISPSSSHTSSCSRGLRVGASASRVGLVDHEVADLDAGVDAVQRLEPALHAGQRVHYWITL